MHSNFDIIQELLHKKADFQARLALLPYDGTPEIKENQSGKYLYMRKREAGKLRSTYVDKYSEELYSLLLRASRESRELKKNIRQVEKDLAALGHTQSDLSARVEMNLAFARANMKANIYDQAILEGVTTTFPQTETVLENGIVNGMTATDIQKILNLKHAWEFILDKDVIASPSNYYVLCHIAKLVNEGFFNDGGRIRGVPVSIGGSSYIPPMPVELDIKEKITDIVENSSDCVETAIKLCLYCMKTQIFTDGNKRASVIFANHYLISQGGGLLVIPEKDVPEFKSLLVAYYENRDNGETESFMKNKCWKQF